MNFKKNVRNQVVIPLTLTLTVLLVTFLLVVFTIRRDETSRHLNHEHSETIAVFKKLLHSKIELMDLLADSLLKDRLLQQAMRRKDRAALYAAAHSYNSKLDQKQITHFYFHDPQGKNFLRVHQPDQHGDTITRTSMRQAMETGKPAHGLELGPYGTLTLRLVIPWKDATGLLGFIELGTEANDLLGDLSVINNIDYLLVVNKSLLNRKAIATGYTWLGKQLQWDEFPDVAIISRSLEQVPPLLHHLLSENSPDLFSVRKWYADGLGSKRYAFRTFPFKESTGRVIGQYILLYDITAQTQQFKRFITITSLAATLLCGMLFALTWRILGQVDQTIATTQQQLSDEVYKVSEANHLLETEIAERQKAEEALRLLNSTLEKRITERTQHLETANSELEQRRIELEQASAELRSRQATILHQDKMASIGLLAAGVAHDINNPIGFVSNNLEELQIYMMRLQELVTTQHAILQTAASAEELEMVNKKWESLGIQYILDDFSTLIAESLDGTNRVSDIVKNLRSFSRVDDIDYKTADINECLESAVRITHHELRHKAILYRNYGKLPQVYCRPQQLNQVFMNLLINAAHAIEKRGEVTLRTWAEQDSVYICIADTGCGIPNELQARIFEPFFTTKDITKGTGLGLSIVSEIVAQHRGEICVESQPGQGTTFTIKLPLRAEVDNA